MTHYEYVGTLPDLRLTRIVKDGVPGSWHITQTDACIYMYATVGPAYKKLGDGFASAASAFSNLGQVLSDQRDRYIASLADLPDDDRYDLTRQEYPDPDEIEGESDLSVDDVLELRDL